MAKAQVKVGGQKEYSVIRMKCDNCGEDVYYVFACAHCGEYLSYAEELKLTKDEIKKLMEIEGKEVKGDVRAIVGVDDEFDGVEEAIGSLEVEEVDDLYSGPFNPL